MSIKEQIAYLYESVFENESVLFKVMPNGVIVREKELFIDNDGKPFQFDSRFDIITYAKANELNNISDGRGNVTVEFAFAYSSRIKLIDFFQYQLRLDGFLIESINNNTADIMQRYFFRNQKDDKYPMNYKALLITATITNVSIENFLCENY
jgi:hypothetical protein